MDKRMQKFGNPGTGKAADPAWKRANVLQVAFPWPMVNAYTGKPQRSAPFHKLGAGKLQQALRNALANAIEQSKDSEAYREHRLRLKQQHGFGETTRFYDDLMADWFHEQAMRLLHQVGGDLFGGSFVFRVMRGGSSLSDHALAIAVDIDPARNPMGQPLRCHLPAWYIEAWRAAGFTWGGDWKHRPDPMHFALKY